MKKEDEQMLPKMSRIWTGTTIAVLFALLQQIHVAGASSDSALTVLYFYSTTCRHCAAISPVVKELSMEFPMRGFVFGEGTSESMPFKVSKGDKTTSARYGVLGVPSLVVLSNDAVITIIQGEYDIRDAAVVLRAFRQGALSISEAVKTTPRQNIIISGWLVNKGEYFKNAKFILTDRRENIQVKPWLLLEVAKSPLRKIRPRLMSDVVNKPVVLRGSLVKKDQSFEFVVKEEILPEKK